jgi:predicted metal-dependent HD superfamily phosphohydrolase
MSPNEAALRLRMHWSDFLARAERAPDERSDRMIAFIIERYGEPGRFYHGVHHPVELLDLYEILRSEKPEWFGHGPTDVAKRLALITHDLDKDSEERSAEETRRFALALGLSERIAMRAQVFVNATAYGKVKAAPLDFGACIVRDIDLSPLAASWETFTKNSDELKRESTKDEHETAVRQRSFLEGVLAWPSIYSTMHFRHRLEDRARANITRALQELY